MKMSQSVHEKLDSYCKNVSFFEEIQITEAQ